MTRQEALNDFSTRHAGMFLVLGAVHSGQLRIGSFAESLAAQLFARGTLSERQIAAFKKVADEHAARKKDAPKVDVEGVEQMFFRASASGYQKPVYRAEGLVISRASANGRNAGALYVKDEETGDYLGKIANGQLFLIREAAPKATEITAALSAIAQNPLDAAIRYGQRTGRCACCGRELTKHTSIDAGIGPICAEKWGFA